MASCTCRFTSSCPIARATNLITLAHVQDILFAQINRTAFIMALEPRSLRYNPPADAWLVHQVYKNCRHEAYVRALIQEASKVRAYQWAGYRSDRGNASRVSRRPSPFMTPFPEGVGREPLKNPRHEIYAQALFRGPSCVEASRRAGYRPGNESLLYRKNLTVQARVYFLKVQARREALLRPSPQGWGCEDHGTS
jgi:hypothetical protein